VPDSSKASAPASRLPRIAEAAIDDKIEIGAWSRKLAPARADELIRPAGNHVGDAPQMAGKSPVT
jgi:hypothetical protein